MTKKKMILGAVDVDPNKNTVTEIPMNKECTEEFQSEIDKYPKFIDFCVNVFGNGIKKLKEKLDSLVAIELNKLIENDEVLNGAYKNALPHFSSYLVDVVSNKIRSYGIAEAPNHSWLIYQSYTGSIELILSEAPVIEDECKDYERLKKDGGITERLNLKPAKLAGVLVDTITKAAALTMVYHIANGLT